LLISISKDKANLIIVGKIIELLRGESFRSKLAQYEETYVILKDFITLKSYYINYFEIQKMSSEISADTIEACAEYHIKSALKALRFFTGLQTTLDSGIRDPSVSKRLAALFRKYPSLLPQWNEKNQVLRTWKHGLRDFIATLTELQKSGMQRFYQKFDLTTASSDFRKFEQDTKQKLYLFNKICLTIKVFNQEEFLHLLTNHLIIVQHLLELTSKIRRKFVRLVRGEIRMLEKEFASEYLL
jgi:hypothetical protein